MDIQKRMMKAPIPGAHLTQDVRKKAWHKPPTYATFDEALEYFFDDVLAKENFMGGIASLTATNMPLTSIVSTMLLGHASKGLYSPDIALKLAGPVYKIISSLLDKFEVDYVSGFESAEELRSKLSDSAPAKVKGKALTPAQEAEVRAMADEATNDIPAGGLMGAPVEGDTMDIPMDEEGMPSLMESPDEEVMEEETP